LSPFAEFRQAFFDGCERTLDGLDAVLASLGREEPPKGALESACRAVHSIKGGGRAFGLDGVAGFAHDFALALERLRQRDTRPGRREVGALLHASGVLGSLIRGGALGTAASPEFLDVLAEVGRGDVALLDWPEYHEPEPEPEPTPQALPAGASLSTEALPREAKRVAADADQGNDILDSWTRVARQVHGKVPVFKKMPRNRGREDSR